MADPTQPELQKIDLTQVKIFWPGPITTQYWWKLISRSVSGIFVNYTKIIKIFCDIRILKPLKSLEKSGNHTL